MSKVIFFEKIVQCWGCRVMVGGRGEESRRKGGSGLYSRLKYIAQCTTLFALC